MLFLLVSLLELTGLKLCLVVCDCPPRFDVLRAPPCLTSELLCSLSLVCDEVTLGALFGIVAFSKVAVEELARLFERAIVKT